MSTSSAPSEIELTRRGGICTVALNRPEKRNALTSGMLGRLCEIFETVGADAETRVLIVRGRGKAFSAGLDLGEMAATRAASGAVRLAAIEDVFFALERVPQPTVAMVQGDAIAGGCELALHCDVRVAATDVRFSMPLARLGLALPVPLIAKLVETIGSAHTKELLYTGDRFDGARALALGMVNHLVPLEDLEATAYRVAETIAANAPLSLRYMKRAIFEVNAFRRAVDSGELDREAAKIGESEDVAEGVAAMREKRPAKFTGR